MLDETPQIPPDVAAAINAQQAPRPEPVQSPQPTSRDHQVAALSAFLTEHLHPEHHEEAQHLVLALLRAERRTAYEAGYEARKAGK